MYFLRSKSKKNSKSKNVTINKHVQVIILDNSRPRFKVQQFNYLNTFKNFIQSKIQTPIINKTKIVTDCIQNCIQNCSKTVKSYFLSKLSSEVCKIQAQIPKQKAMTIKTVKNLNTFIFFEQRDGSAWRIISENFNPTYFGQPFKYKNITHLQTITESILTAMTDLDMYILKKLILTYTQVFQNFGKVADNKQRVILYLIKNMKTHKLFKNTVIEILQSWYFIQPVVIEACRYTGGITNELDQILTDVEALYEYWLNLSQTPKSLRK